MIMIMIMTITITHLQSGARRRRGNSPACRGRRRQRCDRSRPTWSAREGRTSPLRDPRPPPHRDPEAQGQVSSGLHQLIAGLLGGHGARYVRPQAHQCERSVGFSTTVPTCVVIPDALPPRPAPPRTRPQHTTQPVRPRLGSAKPQARVNTRSTGG
jgi:hypothetical protein